MMIFKGNLYAIYTITIPKLKSFERDKANEKWHGFSGPHQTKC